MRQRGFYYTLDRGGTSLLGSALDDEGDAPPADVGCGGLAGALARRQRSALVALACPDLPPSALSGRGLHLQAQQRARCALGRHERGCVSGYRPHLRAAATARAVMAVHAGLATDEAAAARERQELQVIMREEEEWAQLHAAAQKYHEAYAAVRSLSSTRGEPAVVALEVLRGATAALAAAVSGLSAYIVASILSSLAPPSVEAAEERLRTTAFGPVLYQQVRGACMPSWLVFTELMPFSPARAALLLHCHSLLGDISPQLDEMMHAHAASSRLMSMLPGSAVLHLRGPHRAMAATLTEALLRYWGVMPGGAAAAAGGGGGAGSGGGWPAGAPLACSEIRALTLVLSSAQALSYWPVPALGTIGNRGVMAALTRPAVLLRVAAVLSHDVVARIPPGLMESTVTRFLHDLEALWVRTLRRVAASSGSREAEVQQLLHSDEETEAVAGALLTVFSETQKDMHQRAAGMRDYRIAERLKSLATGAESAGAAAEPEAQLHAVQRSAQIIKWYGAVVATAATRLVAAYFDPLPPLPQPAAPSAPAPGSLDAVSEAAATAAASVPGGGACQQGQQPVLAALACFQPQPLPQPQPVPQTVLCIPWRAVQQPLREWYRHERALLHASADEARFGAGWRLASMQVANQAALARAMLGALAPCWEAIMGCTLCGAAAPCTSSLTACDPTYSPGPHSSLVLQGSPAICYTLARTAAVNYVLDRVARGMAAAEAPDLSMAPAPDPSRDVHVDLSASTASDLSTAMAALTSDLEAAPPADVAPAHVAGVLAAAEALSSRLRDYRICCGWPLVVTLSGCEDPERAQHARKVPAELLKPFDPSGLEVEALRQVCVTATWSADKGALQRQQRQAEAAGAGAGAGERAGAEEAAAGCPAAAAAGGGAGAAPAAAPDAAAASSNGASVQQASFLAQAVAQMITGADIVSFPEPSCPGDRLEDMIKSKVEALAEKCPLQPVLLRPRGEQQTAAVASACAEHSHRLRSDAAAPRELVVVPLLDESALHSCGDALERLRGIARLVLRKLTVPVFAPVSGAAAAAGAGGDAGGEVGEAAAAGAAGAAATQSDKGGAAALDVTQPRQQRSFWQYHLPLVLNRAVCRVAGEPQPATGWTLSELAEGTEWEQAQQAKRDEEWEQEDEEGAEDQEQEDGDEEEGEEGEEQQEAGQEVSMQEASGQEAAGEDAGAADSAGSSSETAQRGQLAPRQDSLDSSPPASACGVPEPASASTSASTSASAGAGGPSLHAVAKQLARHALERATPAGALDGGEERLRRLAVVALCELDEALEDLAGAADASESGADDCLRKLLRNLAPGMHAYDAHVRPSPLDHLVAAPCGAGGGECGAGDAAGDAAAGGGGGWPPQALQLLVVQAQSGRPVELAAKGLAASECGCKGVGGLAQCEDGRKLC